MASVSEYCFLMKIFRVVPGVLAGAVLCMTFHSNAAPPPVTGSIVLASHKALYTVTLTGTRAGSDYLDVSGKMILEFTDACDAWTTSQKSLLRTVTGEG